MLLIFLVALLTKYAVVMADLMVAAHTFMDGMHQASL
jgi:hypothetical protein